MKQIFPGVRPPSRDLQAVRDGRVSLPLYFEASLATARSLANGTTSDVTDVSGKALQLNIAGTLFYADPLIDSSGTPIGGVAVAHFQDSALGSGVSTPLTLQPGSRLLIPFTQITIENPAQAGRKLRGIYGVDIDVSAGFNAFDLSDRASRLLGIVYGNQGQLGQTLMGGVQTLWATERGFAYGSAFASAAGLAAGATEQVFAAASNVNGAIVWGADISTQANGAATAVLIGLHAAAVAPAGFTNDVLMVVGHSLQTLAGQIMCNGSLPRAAFLAAGKGLWFRNSGGAAEGGTPGRKVLYTLL